MGFFNKSRNSEVEKPMIRKSESISRSSYLIDQLRGYDWIDDYFKCSALLAELADLKKSRKETTGLPMTKPELIKFAKECFEKYQVERIQKIQESLKTVHLDPNRSSPFQRLLMFGQLQSYRVGSINFMGYFLWSEIEAAIQTMSPDDAAVSKKDRTATLVHIEGRIEKVQAELDAIFPKSRRSDNRGRDRFVRLWCKIQSQVDAPCSPYGTCLKYSSEVEKVAHVRLGIDTFIKPDAPFKPNNP